MVLVPWLLSERMMIMRLLPYEVLVIHKDFSSCSFVSFISTVMLPVIHLPLDIALVDSILKKNHE